MQISQLNIYPIKSTQPMRLEEALVTPRGLQDDRRWALIDENGTAITGRNFPELLDISVKLDESGIQVIFSSENVLTIAYPNETAARVPVHIFSNSTTALVAQGAVNQWFSSYLKTSTRLVFMNKNSKRGLGAKYGGIDGDTVSLADEAPISVISEASLEDLNGRLEQSVTMGHFRPNIVIKDALPFAEDGWKKVRIGTAEFKAGRQCKRCIFTTIDPLTKQKNPQGEPLRTLNTYRKVDGGVIFGQLLIPTKLGKISLGDSVKILK